MEVIRQANITILPYPSLNQEAILQAIDDLQTLLRPISAYGIFASTSKPITGGSGANQEFMRGLSLAGEKSTFGYNTGKITAIKSKGDSFIVKYEGPYEDNLEAPANDSTVQLVFGGPKKHFYSPSQEDCWGKVIAT